MTDHIPGASKMVLTTPPTLCPQCSTPVSVAGDDREGTMHYVNADGREHVCTPPTGRCPHCSFQPESLNDYCEKHRPTPPTGRDEMPDHVRYCVDRVRDGEYLSILDAEERSGEQVAYFAIAWLADSRDRLQSALEKAERELDEARTPDIFGVDDMVVMDDDLGSFDLGPGDIEKVWANRYLGDRYVACRMGEDDEYEHEIFDTEAEAEAWTRAVHHIPDSEVVK